MKTYNSVRAENSTRKGRRALPALMLAAVMLIAALLSSCSAGSAGKTGEPDQESTPFLPGVSGSIELPDDDFTDNTPLPEPTQVPTEVPEEFFESRTYSFIDDAALFKICGRSETTSKGVSCDWSAGGFEINAYCRGDISVKFGVTGANFLAVFVDGERLEEDIYVKNTNTVVVKDLPAGRHHIEVYRQSEVREGRLLLKSLTLNGELEAPPAQKSRYLVFVGDSITSGFGIHEKTVSGASSHVDATMAYPFLTARELDADVDVVAVIGIGLVKGYVTETMGKVFPLIDYYRSTKNTYSAARRPDAVVVNLGTNDATHSSDPAQFKEAAKDLIDQIRTTYGADVPIVWVYNSMRADHYKYTLEVVDELAGAGVNITALKVPMDSSAAGHPSAAAHIKDKDVIVAHLKELLKW
ncbi:MAG: hypothetical protein J6V14_00260 [Clostridia bacterium]|nr:hypothetical protein [Clostridia bacterium]